MYEDTVSLVVSDGESLLEETNERTYDRRRDH